MSDDLEIANYCACFIDLLGQRDALLGEGLLPVILNEEEAQQFRLKLKRTIAPINALQRDSEIFLVPEADSIIDRNALSPDDRAAHDEMKKTIVKQQRWSDGLVLYTSMQNSKAPMNAIWQIIGTAGILCLFGLCNKRPIRGGVEISWGVELHENELYGPVVANSYRLESEVARSPRICVGEILAQYLLDTTRMITADKAEIYNCHLASSCLKMIVRDDLGIPYIDYLGREFTTVFNNENNRLFYNQAYDFVRGSHEYFSENQNEKLAQRYMCLLRYFDSRAEIHA